MATPTKIRATPRVTRHNPYPSDDLRKYKIPGGFQYIMQATHTTNGGYVDKVDMTIKATKAGSLIRAFSSSGIHGALGDNGQNTTRTLHSL